MESQTGQGSKQNLLRCNCNSEFRWTEIVFVPMRNLTPVPPIVICLFNGTGLNDIYQSTLAVYLEYFLIMLTVHSQKCRD